MHLRSYECQSPLLPPLTAPPLFRSVVRLRGYEGFLGQCQSGKSIDIRKREAEALRARVDRDMAGEEGGGGYGR